MRGRKKKSYAGENYWPGYVDAMVNIVLNLLFMVAVFGIALTVFNSIPKSNRIATAEDRERQREQADLEAELGESQNPPDSSTTTEAAPASVVSQDSQESVTPEEPLAEAQPELVPNDYRIGVSEGTFVSVELPSFEETPIISSESKVGVPIPSVVNAAPSSGPVDVAAATPQRLPNDGVPPVGATGPVDVAAATPQRLPNDGVPPVEATGPVDVAAATPQRLPNDGVPPVVDIPQEQIAMAIPPKRRPDDFVGARNSALAEDQISVVIADTFARRGGPKAQLTQRTDTSGRTIMTLDVPVAADPITTFARPYLAAAFKTTLPVNNSEFTVITTTETKEPLQRRSSFLALSVIRNQLIAAGVSPDRIEIRMLDGSPQANNGLKFFVVASNSVEIGAIQNSDGAVVVQEN